MNQSKPVSKSSPAKLARPRLLQNGQVDYVMLPVCECREGDRRGPQGGVCACGGAIPDDVPSVDRDTRSA